MKSKDDQRDPHAAVAAVKAKIAPILRRHGATRAGLFGSLVRGEARPDSDVDLLVEFGPGLSLLDIERINRELEDALGRRVDLVEYEALKPRIREVVLSQEVRIL